MNLNKKIIIFIKKPPKIFGGFIFYSYLCIVIKIKTYMQVFIIGTPLETARVLDKVRLNKQIIECHQILNAIQGKTKSWKNHPVVLQYKCHEEWLKAYTDILTNYRDGNYISAEIEDFFAFFLTPKFHTVEFFNQMKRRLYTKKPEHYWKWYNLGESLENWYFVDGEMRKYINGKRIK